MSEEISNSASENGPESHYRRLSRITLVVMIYGAIGTHSFIVLAGILGLSGFRSAVGILLYPMSGCVLAFFLGVVAYVLLICFGAMRMSLRTLLISALIFGFGATVLVSGEPFIYLGLATLAVLFLYWVYHFFKAVYEQDRRDGIV